MVYETYLTQIEFLLKAENIYFDSKQDEDALQSTSSILQTSLRQLQMNIKKTMTVLNYIFQKVRNTMLLLNMKIIYLF